MSIHQIMTPEPLCIRPTSTIAEAARLMSEHDIGMLPVCEQDRLIGTVTDRDLVVRGLAHGADPNQSTIRDVMTSEVVSCFDSQSIDDVCRVMGEKQIRRIPIVSDDMRLVGIVALGDIVVRTGSELRGGATLEQVSQP
jgi:CBS domain-containing protein